MFPRAVFPDLGWYLSFIVNKLLKKLNPSQCLIKLLTSEKVGKVKSVEISIE